MSAGKNLPMVSWAWILACRALLLCFHVVFGLYGPQDLEGSGLTFFQQKRKLHHCLHNAIIPRLNYCNGTQARHADLRAL